MNFSVFALYFASGISMLLVIYTAYLLVKGSKGDFANAFKIIIVGHFPSAIMYFLASLSYFGIMIIPDEGSAAYDAIKNIVHVTTMLSIFISIYVMKVTLFDKIARFAAKKKKVATK